MRGEERQQRSMLMVHKPGDRVPRDHPLRRIKKLADAALAELSPIFDEMYSAVGRPSIPPERLLKSLLLMALYTVRSERLFCEQLDYNLLFRWFLDMDMDEPSFDLDASRATASGCSSTTWRASSSGAWSRRRAQLQADDRTTTSRWTAR